MRSKTFQCRLRLKQGIEANFIENMEWGYLYEIQLMVKARYDPSQIDEEMKKYK